MNFTPWKAWLVAAVASILVEMLPPPTHFFFLCVALGALAASITAFFSTVTWLPWIVFSIVTVALIPMLIPLARFLFTPKSHASNVDALIGQKALVIERIDPKAHGVVKIHGETWRAASENDVFNKDEWVNVDRIEGTHVIVRRTS
jgi:membrane protein implicated in regulation of membrane protease activity